MVCSFSRQLREVEENDKTVVGLVAPFLVLPTPVLRRMGLRRWSRGTLISGSAGVFYPLQRDDFSTALDLLHNASADRDRDPEKALFTGVEPTSSFKPYWSHCSFDADPGRIHMIWMFLLRFGCNSAGPLPPMKRVS